MKDQKNLWLIISAVAILIIIIGLVYTFTKPSGNIEGDQENKTTLVQLEKTSFEYSDYYFNDGVFIRGFCADILAGDCQAFEALNSNTENCHMADVTLKYKVSNLPSKLTEQTDYLQYIKYKAYNGDQDITGYAPGLYHSIDEKFVLVDFPLDIRENHNVGICLKVEGTDLESEELCLDSVKVEALC